MDCIDDSIIIVRLFKHFVDWARSTVGKGRRKEGLLGELRAVLLLGL